MLSRLCCRSRIFISSYFGGEIRTQFVVVEVLFGLEFSSALTPSERRIQTHTGGTEEEVIVDCEWFMEKKSERKNVVAVKLWTRKFRRFIYRKETKIDHLHLRRKYRNRSVFVSMIIESLSFYQFLLSRSLCVVVVADIDCWFMNEWDFVQTCKNQRTMKVWRWPEGGGLEGNENETLETSRDFELEKNDRNLF